MKDYDGEASYLKSIKVYGVQPDDVDEPGTGGGEDPDEPTPDEPEDEYLTKNSAKFHEHLGYKTVGEFHKCGYKFGRWYNMIWMEKMLGEHTTNPKRVKLI